MDADYHAHTNYSDGGFLEFMVGAAADAGLEAIGLTDHCTVSERAAMRDRRRRAGYNLDLTYERRREAIESVREEADLTVYDAVEVDYDPRDEAAIADFLEAAAFEYAVGSVHGVGGVNVHVAEPFRSKTPDERRALVDSYFEDLEALVRSELFEVAAHPDIVERNEALRGIADEEHYRRAAEAFADSRTVPEVNAGRIDDDYGEFHPRPAFLDALLDRGVEVTVGTDSHAPGQVGGRVSALATLLADRGISPVSPVDG